MPEKYDMPWNTNLNVKEVVDGGPDSEWPKFGKLKDYSTVSNSGMTSVYFRDILNRLLSHIRHADAVLGCVAWLTNREVLGALKGRPTSIVIAKDGFNKNDKNLLERYKKLPGILPESLDNVVRALDVNAPKDVPLDAIRCVGYRTPDEFRRNNNSFPMMHNKFLIFCEKGEFWDKGLREYHPYAVWTGSFNFSHNAVKNFENAVYMGEPEIVHAYFHEYAQIMAISESIFGTGENFGPEWTTG